jgi:hypothetical protein
MFRFFINHLREATINSKTSSTGVLPLMFKSVLLGCWMVGKIVYEKPKHVGAYNVFIRFLTFS